MHNFFYDLTSRERKVFERLNTPQKIQDFLGQLPQNFYESSETCYSPRMVLKKKRAHCFEGALFAASALWYHGQKPLLLDLVADSYDYDHVVALFKQDGCWGAISKTNYAVLRYREPIYKTIRELVLSYFHEYFLDDGRKTLRKYSQPFDLRKFSQDNWIVSDKPMWYIGDVLDDSPHLPILNNRQIKNLRKADPIEIKAGKLRQWKK
jgi:hypothetical protein